MDSRTVLDVTFDFRSDTPPGRDPDAFSPMLRKYHKILWNKLLPSGVVFELNDTASVNLSRWRYPDESERRRHLQGRALEGGGRGESTNEASRDRRRRRAR